MKGGEHMLKEYFYNGARYQFTEGEQPEGAVEVGKPPVKAEPAPANKAVKPANKSRAVKTK